MLSHQPVLWDLIQRDDNSSALRVLLQVLARVATFTFIITQHITPLNLIFYLMALFCQEYLQMPRDSIRTLVMSAEKDAVKRFISHMHQSWDQLQVETSQVCFETPNKIKKTLFETLFYCTLFYGTLVLNA